MDRIYVDFNTSMADPRERVYINTKVDPDLLAVLRDGARALLYDGGIDGCIEVVATAEFDPNHDRWYGCPDWTTLHHVEGLEPG